MKRFVSKTVIFLLPLLMIVVFVFVTDPLKVWFSYDDYYSDYFVTLNREDVCLNLYNQRRETCGFDSFILGSSRSLAFKAEEWQCYLEPGASPFHFDASGEGLYGILNKLRYLDELSDPVNNVLLILDEDCMTNNYNRSGYLFISPPALSNESNLAYYKTFLIASLHPKFLIAYFDYKLFRNRRAYMANFISAFIPKGNNGTGDVWFWSYDECIRRDSVGYYDHLINVGVFYDRNKQRFDSCTRAISTSERKQLIQIAGLLKKHKTNYKIIISPLYDQIPMCRERLNLLNTFFGREHVYDFSGKNRYTEQIGNYYESSHYRPCVARDIMKAVYRNNRTASSAGEAGPGEVLFQ